MSPEEFRALMARRYACRKFDPGRRINDSVVDHILECARLSPSSFGLEPWEFLRFRQGPTMERLGAACFGQEAVTSADLAVAILVRREGDFDPEGGFVRERSARFPGGTEAFVPDYRGYWEFLRGSGRLLCWSRAQAYIACANMMTGAMAAGVDSCAIEGFDEAAVLACSRTDPETRAVGLVVAFGYSDALPAPKIREPAESFVRDVP